MPRKAASSKSTGTKESVMDVSPPGKSEANASSRPLIITRKPMIQDPMVREQTQEIPGPPTLDPKASRLRNFLKPKGAENTGEVTELEPNEENTDPQKASEPATTETDNEPMPNIPAVKELIEPEDVQIGSKPEELKPGTVTEPVQTEVSTKEVSKKPVIKPLQDAKKPADSLELNEEAVAPPADKQPNDPKEEKVGEETTNESANIEESTDKTQATIEQNPGGGLVDELAKQAVDKKQKGQAEKEADAHQTKVQSLVNDKTYFLPIGEVTRRKKNRSSLVGLLMVILLLAGAYAVIDAGFVEVPFKLPVDFIHNTQ